MHGLTLVETVIALAILSVGLMGIMSAFSSISNLADANHEQLLALNIARQKKAEVETTTFGSIFAQYHPDANDNPSSFNILDTDVSKDKNGVGLQNAKGYVIFPSTNGRLDETTTKYPELGMPMDLNGDGNINSTNVPGGAQSDPLSYKLLPMRIRITWTSGTVNREVNLVTMLAKLK